MEGELIIFGKQEGELIIFGKHTLGTLHIRMYSIF